MKVRRLLLGVLAVGWLASPGAAQPPVARPLVGRPPVGQPLVGQPHVGPPAQPISLEETVVESEIVSTLFDKFLKYKAYRVLTSGGALYEGGFVYGPGTHISAMAALVLDEKGTPWATFKTGDTRLSRAGRGEPYVATSGIAGRWDKTGVSAVKIVLGELSEEVGGSVVEGTFRPLGGALSPTMPFESTESDEYFMAAVKITGSPYGDGGQMEVADLIGPVFYSPEEAIHAMDEGRISDAARARTMFGRAWDSIGYLPGLDVYVQDYPALSARFQTLGLGPVDDLRLIAKGGAIPPARAKSKSLKARINDVSVVSTSTVDLEPDQHMVDARIQHAVEEQGATTLIPPDFASQYLKLDYDRAKVAIFYFDKARGPMVEMTPQVRPALAFAPGSPRVVRLDIRDLQVEKTEVPRPTFDVGESDFFLLNAVDPIMSGLQQDLPSRPVRLAMHNAASSGQSDLFYHYLACEIDAPTNQTDFLTLADALTACRAGHGDAQTEATLLRLADHLGWIPELGMGKSDALLEVSPHLRTRH